ncbi:MAG: hypothetical protein ACI9N1_002753 [Flavobacteriales bacterium]|jgi:hypothetical protein
MQKTILLSIIVILLSCSEKETKKVDTDKSVKPTKKESAFEDQKLIIEEIDLPTDSLFLNSHYRGVQIKDGIGYISGSNSQTPEVNLKTGSVYRFLHNGAIPNMEFRDIHRTNNSSLNMSIVKPSGLFTRCSDASRQSSISPPDTIGFFTRYAHTDTLCFLDGMDFWNDSVGIVFGDPLDGYPFALKTNDGGTSWNRIAEEKLPKSLEVEAGFAASGTSIVCVGEGVGYIGLGGEQARIFKTTDYGDTWKATNTNMLQGEAGMGIYSMSFKDELNGVAVGGNWENTTCGDSKIYTNDGGLTWQSGLGVQEYRSCVTYWKDGIYISTGTSGTDISYDDGAHWQMLDTLGFNSIAFMDNGQGIGVGNRGLIRKLNLQNIKR